MKQAKQRKFLSILLTVVMVIVMFPMTVFAENDKVVKVSENEPQNLYVGNTAIIDNGNLTGNEIQGVSYSNGTLYLTGVTVSDAHSFIYNSKDTSSAIYSDASLTISLENENTINASAGNSILVLGEVHIIGQGSLESTNTSVGICADSIILDYDGSMDFSCQWEGLKAVAGDISICNGSLDIISLREWASSIGTLAGDLYVQGGNLKIEEKSLNAYACYIRGNAYFSGGVVETVGENSEIYIYGNCTISAGHIKAEQIRTQNGGALTISGGTLDIYGRGLWSSDNILILADSMRFSGKRIYSDKKIHIDTSEVVLGEEVEKLQMEGSAFVVNSVGSFPYQFRVFKEAYYDMSRKVAYINNDDTHEADISFYEGVLGNKTYVKGCVAYMNGGTMPSTTEIEQYKLAIPVKVGCIFDGWYENDNFTGDAVTVVEPGKNYYAKWIEEEPGNDKEDLAALIEYAQDAKNAENYKYLVPKVKELFEKALEDAIEVNEKEDATQKEIDDAYDALLAKVHLLDFTGNTESLKVLIDAAETKYRQEEMYTKESWAPFAKAFEAAKELLKDENALQADIDAAREALQAAMDALVEKPIDTKKLEKLIADSKQYEDNIDKYTSDSAKAFMATLDGAREVLASEKITQEAVDSAYKTLLNAIFGLREVPNKDRLEELLGKVEAMDLSAYSEETASAVKAAVAMAAAVMEDENANQEQVDAAVAALEEAVASLEAKEEVGTGDINTDNTEDTSGEDENSVTDKKVVSNDEGSKDTANKTTTAKTNVKTAAQTGDAAKAAVPAVTAVAALLAVWFVWKKK